MTTNKTQTPDTQPSEGAINKFIHERLMGKCWHERQTFPIHAGWIHTDSESMSHCVNCNQAIPLAQFRNPNYCSGKSERDLLDEAVAKLVQTSPAMSSKLYDHLYDLVRSRPGTDGHQILLSPFEIARAMYECLEEK